MTWSSVDWAATEAVVGRIQDRIFRAAKIKRPRLEPDDEQSSCPVLRGLGSGNGARLPDDVFRLNFSHGTHEDHKKRYDLIRQIEQETGRPIGVLVDLQGPKLRVGAFENGRITLRPGETFGLDLDGGPGTEEP